MSNKSKTVILFTSRNNYELFEGIFFKNSTVDFSDYILLNIDLNSSEEQLSLAKKTLKKYNITNIDVDQNDPNIYAGQRGIEICINYLESNNIEADWILWATHDNPPVGSDFLVNYEKKLLEYPEFKQRVGVIGFQDYGLLAENQSLIGRGVLIDGLYENGRAGWYTLMPSEYYKSDYFIVESPVDNAVAINVGLWKKHIEVDYGFRLYLWVEDVSAQFNLLNIASVTIPSLELVDLCADKQQFGIPKCSLDSTSDYCMDTGRQTNWMNYWKKKYGFERSNRDKFSLVSHLYKKTLQEKIYGWHVDDGPKTLRNLGGAK